MSYWSYKSYLAALVPCGIEKGDFCTLCDFFSLAQNIFNFVALTLVPIAAVLLIFWGGYMFLISGGDQGGVTKAKSILKNTVIGLVIVYTAYLAASYTVKFFAGASGVAGSRFTAAGFSIQCTRVELPDKTGVKIGELAAPIADKIFRGIPVGTIPVVTPEQSLWINYKRAAELGLTVSQDLLNRADKIIR